MQVALLLLLVVGTVGVHCQQFSCTELAASSSVPTSVHKLRPGDIKVIAALGDSITVGAVAESRSLFEFGTEYRGISWSIGGDATVETTTTLPNFFKKFNPNIKGWSFGTGDGTTPNAQLNVAESGAKGSNMATQAQTLVDKVRADSSIDFDNDWKVVTIFVGGNDLCRVCEGSASAQPNTYIGHIETALDLLRTSLPRTFVNLVTTIDVTELYQVSVTAPCKAFVKGFCPCGTSTVDASQRNLTHHAFLDYVTLTHSLAALPRFSLSDNFTVVVQPFFEQTSFPLSSSGAPDTSYLALDCFHFSKKSHMLSGRTLWNNMLEAVGSKIRAWNATDETIMCPTVDRPYLATQLNSLSATVESSVEGDVETTLIDGMETMRLAESTAAVETTLPAIETTQDAMKTTAIAMETTQGAMETTQDAVETTQDAMETTAIAMETTQDAMETTQDAMGTTVSVMETTQVIVGGLGQNSSSDDDLAAIVVGVIAFFLVFIAFVLAFLARSRRQQRLYQLPSRSHSQTGLEDLQQEELEMQKGLGFSVA